jgi:type VI secretion system FHA domain protein
MILTLEITGPQAAKLGPAYRKEFTTAGGTIGRLRDNYWVLTDPWVSSRHALIRFVNGAFYIEDTSTNGVFINSPDNRLVPGQPYALKSGDSIFIDPYEIRAVITAKAKEGGDPFRVDDLFGPWSAPAPKAPIPPLPSTLEPDVRAGPSDEVDWLDRLGPGREAKAPHGPKAADLAGNSVLSDHYYPPAPVSPGPAPAPPSEQLPIIPDDYDPLFSDERPALPAERSSQAVPRGRSLRSEASPARSSVEAPSSAPPPVASVRPRPSAHEAKPSVDAQQRDGPVVSSVSSAVGAERVRPVSQGPVSGREVVALAAVLEGAGLEGVPVTPELARSFGEILRVVVAGVMDVLQARQRIKNEFRMEMTSFKPAANNPLKFSANVDDALHNLLVKRNAAYLGPVEAFEDAFDDLRNHQMAMLAGVRVAFQAMLEKFDPDALQEQFDRDLKKGALLSMPGKLRYWDLYRERIRDMVQDSETSFRELFGEEFATAYEAQLARLKAEGRGRKR